MTEDHPNATDLANKAEREAAYWRERCEAMSGALSQAVGWFIDYERQHRAKRTTEAALKADVNADRAAFLASFVLVRENIGPGSGG